MKTVIAITIIIVALAAGVSWHEHERTAAARATLAALDAERVKLDAGIATARIRIAAARQRQAELERKERPAQSLAEQPPAPAAAPEKPDTAMSLDKYPGLRALFRRSIAGNLMLRYGAFYRTAKLTPEQIGKFERVMTEAEETKMDFELAARSQGFKPSDSALANLRAQGETKLKAGLIDALGDSGYEQYQQYRRVEPLTGIIGDMTTIAVQHDAAFTAAQADRLMTSIANASPGYQAGGKVDPLTVNWSQVLIEAKPYLSPTQFAVVQQAGDVQQVYLLLKQFYAQRKPSRG
jgi:hypothetical protein